MQQEKSILKLIDLLICKIIERTAGIVLSKSDAVEDVPVVSTRRFLTLLFLNENLLIFDLHKNTFKKSARKVGLSFIREDLLLILAQK